MRRPLLPQGKTLMANHTFATSGTTGQRKTYTISDELLARRIAHMSNATRGDGFESMKSLFIDWSEDSYWGIAYTCYADQHGIKAYCASHDSAEQAVELFKREGIEGITGTPERLYHYAQVAKGRHQFKWLLASTARLTPTMSVGIRGGLGNNLWSSYGTSEVGIISIATANQIETIHNCVGKVVPDVEISFDNREILVKSKLLISGYDDNPTLTSQRFRQGWYYTHDLGHMEDGLLVLDGRKR